MLTDIKMPACGSSSSRPNST